MAHPLYQIAFSYAAAGRKASFSFVFMSPDPVARRLNYPSERLAGNDDATTGDPETNDPYSTSAQLKGTDFPTRSPLNFEGSDGDTFEIRAQWEEFTRLQIGQKWYIISKPYPWRLHFRFKKASGVWEDDSSSLATDNAGF